MSRKESGSRTDICARITDRIVEELEKGVRPWVQPWRASHMTGRITRPLRHNGEPYTGMNVLLLWSEAMARGYAAPIWMTFRQASERGAHVRKGEPARPSSMPAGSPRRKPMRRAARSTEIFPF